MHPEVLRLFSLWDLIRETTPSDRKAQGRPPTTSWRCPNTSRPWCIGESQVKRSLSWYLESGQVLFASRRYTEAELLISWNTMFAARPVAVLCQCHRSPRPPPPSHGKGERKCACWVCCVWSRVLRISVLVFYLCPWETQGEYRLAELSLTVGRLRAINSL